MLAYSGWGWSEGEDLSHTCKGSRLEEEIRGNGNHEYIMSSQIVHRWENKIELENQ